MRGLKRDSAIYTNSSSDVTVYSGSINNGDIAVAIKEQRHDSIEAANAVLKEALVMTGLAHNNVVRLYDARLEERKQTKELWSVLVLELMDRTLRKEVQERMAVQRPYSEEELLGHLAALTDALCLAKKDQISHRALSLSTVFVRENTLKLGGFASSAQHFDGLLSRSTLPTPSAYLSPELKSMSGSQYNPFQADVYSLGMVVLTMAKLEELQGLEDGLDQGQLTHILQSLTQYPQLTRYLEGMLRTDPQERVAFENLRENLQQTLPLPGEFLEVPAVRCQTCHKQTSQQLQRQVYQPSNLDFCSLSCYARSLHPQFQQCQRCSSSFSDDAVFLRCEHSFHSKECFFTFLCEASKQFSRVVTYQCPACSWVIEQSLIYFIFGEAEYNRRTKEVYEQLCCLCHEVEGNTVFRKCNHRSCRRCVKTLFFLDLCPICRGS